jgi:hypothetical protein
MVSYATVTLFKVQTLTHCYSAGYLGLCVMACLDARRVHLEKKRKDMEERKIGDSQWL